MVLYRGAVCVRSIVSIAGKIFWSASTESTSVSKKVEYGVWYACGKDSLIRFRLGRVRRVVRRDSLKDETCGLT
jgi:hypothetical protein